MTKMTKLCCLMILFIFFSGCARRQAVSPLRSEISGEICIIEDVKVREGFLPVLKATLEELGYKVRVVPQKTAISDCETTVTYKGLWSWDVTIYLGYANVSAYRNGALIGSAEYRVPKLNLKKWVNAEDKIRELVKAVFPPFVEPAKIVTPAKKEINQLEKKADAGDANAQFKLGQMYYSGEGVKQDYLKAKYYYKQAAAQGHKEAQKELKFLE